jgi:class 3 adenylate cyclase/pimeloyl-ACP methyl ester carboxylesterase
MIWPAYWVSHLEVEWENPFIQSCFKRLAVKHTVIRYDKHGCGLSDRDRTDFSLEKEVRDLEAIIDHLKLQRFSLFGMSGGGPTAIAYAVKHPELVSHLILYGTYPRGNVSGPPEIMASLCNLIRTTWGLGSKTLADIFVPDSGMEGLKFFSKWQRKAATGEIAARILESVEHLDVTELLPKITTPTLVVHRKGDRACSVQGGRELAASIPNARFVLLEGTDHVPWFGDSESVLRATMEFLGDEIVSISEPLIEKPEDKKKYERKLTTILSADVKEYSRLMSDNEEDTIATLTSYREIMIAIIKKYGGRVIDSVGDNLLAEFNSVLNAVECSVEIQKNHRGKNNELPDKRRMKFRIGINLGDVIEEEERLYGDGVNIAARIQGLAEGGGICISGSVYDQVEHKLRFRYDSLKEQTVKNIPRPVRVYQIKMEPEVFDSKASKKGKVHRIY